MPSKTSEVSNQAFCRSDELFKEIFKIEPPKPLTSFQKDAQSLFSSAPNRTSYQVAHLDSLDAYKKWKQQPEIKQNPSTQLSLEAMQSATVSKHFFGADGTSPYDRMPQEATHPFYFANDGLMKGTVKLSDNLPGYYGHVPENDYLRRKISLLRAKHDPRTTHSKTLIVENHHVNIPGCTLQIKKL